MQRITLPNTDLELSALCLGGAVFGSSLSGEAADQLMHDFLEAGGNFVDTAHCYSFWEPAGAGSSEREVGAILRRMGMWEQVVVGTKGGHPVVGEGYPRPDRYLAPEVIASDVKDSLTRLGRDQIDLYYLHRDDTRTPVDEIIDALNAEVDQGRVRYLAASNWSTERMTAANAYAAQSGKQGFVASQVQWSLSTPTWTPGPDPTTRYVTEEDAVWHQETGLPIVAYSATANGYFAGTASGTKAYDTPENAARKQRAEQLAAEWGCTANQVALAYLRYAGPVTIPLFSTSRREHLAEGLGSLAITLTPEQCKWLQSGYTAA
jgi:aryl-alcohol dehydrogenase-like predicted oxidoreductase